MSYTTVLAEIDTLLSGVTGIANVYDRVRTEDVIADQRAAFISGSKFHTWFITRSRMPAQLDTNTQVQRDHEFLLIGFYGMADADQTENVFQQLCDDVCNAFDTAAAVALGNTADQLVPATIESFENGVIMGGALCHRAIIKIIASECVSP